MAELSAQRLASSGLVATTWSLAGTGRVCEDRHATISRSAATLRVVICDGVTSWRALPHQPSAGAWAAQTAAHHLLGAGNLPDAALAANHQLHDPDVTPSRRQAMTAAVAADVRTAGPGLHLAGLVAGDCEVWVPRAGRLQLAAGGDFLLPAVRRAWQRRKQQLGDLPFDHRLAVEAELLEDPTTQLRHALGRYASPTLQHFELSAPAAVLASDGADLASAAASGLPLHRLGRWLAQVASRSSRDDLTCTLVQPA